MTVETRRRSLAKALSWRVIAWSITAAVAYAFTGKVGFALSIGFADSVIKIFAYYMHERTWMTVDFGRAPVPTPAVEEPGAPELVHLQPSRSA
ncbi:MAG: DUF2061 domain-containing protein [Deltaproteobacteria bacterium]|nr:DUF2061 domain-containing protein [Deltaproteobacteria bacterium]